MNNTVEENAYNKLNHLRTQSSWKQWPPEIRAVIPEMARQRSAAMQEVWFPSVVYIEPTNVCNANCIFCPRHTMTRPTGYMSLTLYRRLIEQIAALGPSEIRLFHYGEPMLHSELPDMVRIAREHGLQARFQTNGLRMERDMIHRLLDAGMTYIGVSVNGLTAAAYEAVRPGLSFSQLVKNLTRLRTLIDEAPGACHIHLNAHADRADISEDDPDLRAYKKQWFHVADSLSVSGIRLYDGVSTLQGGSVISTLEARCEQYPVELHCTEPFDRLVIKWDGRVSPCCVDHDARMIIGDATRETIVDIWNSTHLNKLQNDFRNKTYTDWPLCEHCPKRHAATYNLLFVRNTYQTGQTDPKSSIDMS